MIFGMNIEKGQDVMSHTRELSFGRFVLLPSLAFGRKVHICDSLEAKLGLRAFFLIYFLLSSSLWDSVWHYGKIINSAIKPQLKQR